MEYRSGASLLGLPLVHIALSSVVDGRFRRGVATGWIAIGGVALGIVAIGGAAVAWYAAIGGLAVAPRSTRPAASAMAPQLIAPTAANIPSFASIPHAPFRWTDAVWLALIAWVLLRVASAVQARRGR